MSVFAAVARKNDPVRPSGPRAEGVLQPRDGMVTGPASEQTLGSAGPRRLGGGCRTGRAGATGYLSNSAPPWSGRREMTGRLGGLPSLVESSVAPRAGRRAHPPRWRTLRPSWPLLCRPDIHLLELTPEVRTLRCVFKPAGLNTYRTLWSRLILTCVAEIGSQPSRGWATSNGGEADVFCSDRAPDGLGARRGPAGCGQPWVWAASQGCVGDTQRRRVLAFLPVRTLPPKLGLPL